MDDGRFLDDGTLGMTDALPWVCWKSRGWVLRIYSLGKNP